MTTADAQIELSVVIPAYNEAANVPVVVEQAMRELAADAGVAGWELILINDGSTDGTREVIDRLAAQDDRVRAVHHDANRGFGAALRTGYAAARGKFVTLISGDGEIGVDQALRLLHAIGPADLIISRRVRPVQVSRSVLSAVFGFLTRVNTGFDPAEMSGIYVIRREVLQQLPLHSSTGVVNYEVVMRCAARGSEIRHGLTEVKSRLSGHSKVTNATTIVKAAWELMKLRLPRPARSGAAR
jgi:glycosyltransferase involved in cell wall biosynthesis